MSVSREHEKANRIPSRVLLGRLPYCCADTAACARKEEAEGMGDYGIMISVFAPLISRVEEELFDRC